MWEIEQKGQREAQEQAKEHGFELLTPQAAMHLFGISAPAVRQARIGRRVHAPFTLDIGSHAVHLLDLASATEYWRSKKRPDFDEILEDMRDTGHILGVSGIGYNVLHVKPIIRWEDDVDGVDA